MAVCDEPLISRTPILTGAFSQANDEWSIYKYVYVGKDVVDARLSSLNQLLDRITGIDYDVKAVILQP